ncbi:MAG: LCP family protein, partial [Pseudonocardia sp.]
AAAPEPAPPGSAGTTPADPALDAVRRSAATGRDAGGAIADHRPTSHSPTDALATRERRRTGPHHDATSASATGSAPGGAPSDDAAGSTDVPDGARPVVRRATDAGRGARPHTDAVPDVGDPDSSPHPSPRRSESDEPASDAPDSEPGDDPDGETPDADGPTPRRGRAAARAARSLRARLRGLTRATARVGSRLGITPRIAKITIAVLAGLIVVSTGTGAASRSWLDAAVTQAYALDPQSPAIRNADGQAGDENVVVLTTDFPRPGAAPNPGAASLVVAHVPRDSDSVVALSLPADLEINRPPCELWDPQTRTYRDQTVPAEVRTTLLSAFEVGGPRCTTKAVQQLTGLAVTRFVAVDRTGLAEMARAVGVDPCPPGPAPATDEDRIERDHGQLLAVLSRTLSVPGLLALPQVTSLHGTLPSAILADQVDLGRLLGIASALDDLEADRITYAATPVQPTPNIRGFSEMREAEASTLFKAVREDTSLPAPAIRAVGTAQPGPGDVTVDVFNASGRDGLARGVAGRLADMGFGVDEIGNAASTERSTVITYSPDRAAGAELLQSSVPAASLVPEPSASGVLELTLGGDFDRTADEAVRAPGDPAAAAVATATSACS